MNMGMKKWCCFQSEICPPNKTRIPSIFPTQTATLCPWLLRDAL